MERQLARSRAASLRYRKATRPASGPHRADAQLTPLIKVGDDAPLASGDGSGHLEAFGKKP